MTLTASKIASMRMMRYRKLIYMIVVIICGLLLAAIPSLAQITVPIISAEDTADVIDHTRFDSLWNASMKGGSIFTGGVLSECYTTYREAMSRADPTHHSVNSRLAFWINSGYACLMEVMDRSVGYRHVTWDSLFLVRDTFQVAGNKMTLQRLHDTIVGTIRDTRALVFCASGSTTSAPLPAHVAFAANVRILMRDQLRKVCRSEKFILWDPAANVLQLSSLFRPYYQRMMGEARNAAQWILPYVSEATAASLAMHQDGMIVQIVDRIERFRKRQAARKEP